MIELRPYQTEAIEDLRNGFRQSHVRQVLCAPTGAVSQGVAGKARRLAPRASSHADASRRATARCR